MVNTIRPPKREGSEPIALRSRSRPPSPAAVRRLASDVGAHRTSSAAIGNQALQRLARAGATRPRLSFAPRGGVHEQVADRAASLAALGQRVPAPLRGRSGRGLPAGGGPAPGLPADPGRPLDPATRRFAEPAFGTDLRHVRLHDSPLARLTAARIGARAFASSNHIWLGPRESESDRLLMAHELAHVLQRGDDLIYLRAATWLERRAWLSFFDHYLPRKFLNNYMDDTGAPITLSHQEMIDVNPIVNITRSPAFLTELHALQAQVKASAQAGQPVPAVRAINVSGPGQAMTNGTLGNFTIRYSGTLMVDTSGTWTFIGVMTFYDIWDFDPKPFGTSGRSTAGEVKTRVAAYGLPGKPFEIFSVALPLTQTGSDPRAVWAGGAPTHVPDRAGTAGLDVETGAAGGAVLGPETEVGGGEVGAQSAEDLNP
jgi:hypothetical protein